MYVDEHMVRVVRVNWNVFNSLSLSLRHTMQSFTHMYIQYTYTLHADTVGFSKSFGRETIAIVLSFVCLFVCFLSRPHGHYDLLHCLPSVFFFFFLFCFWFFWFLKNVSRQDRDASDG